MYIYIYYSKQNPSRIHNNPHSKSIFTFIIIMPDTRQWGNIWINDKWQNSLMNLNEISYQTLDIINILHYHHAYIWLCGEVVTTAKIAWTKINILPTNTVKNNIKNIELCNVFIYIYIVIQLTILQLTHTIHLNNIRFLTFLPANTYHSQAVSRDGLVLAETGDDSFWACFPWHAGKHEWPSHTLPQIVPF